MIGTVLGKMILYFGSDAKRIHHAMKVYCFSCALWDDEARTTGLSDSDERKNTLLLAAVLHDIGIQEDDRWSSKFGNYYCSILNEYFGKCHMITLRNPDTVGEFPFEVLFFIPCLIFWFCC